MVYRTAFVGLACLMAAMGAAPAMAETSTAWPGEASGDGLGTIHRADGSDEGPVLRRLSVADIEAGCTCSLADVSGGDPEEAIVFALSVVWVDLYDYAPERVRGQVVLTGEAITETGERDFAATLSGMEPSGVFTVLLTPMGALDAVGTGTLFAEWLDGGPAVSEPAGPAIAAAAPAGETAPAPRRAAVAAGVYPVPQIVQQEDFSQAIVNWTETEPGVLVANPGDPMSPRQTKGTLDTPSRWTTDAIFKEIFRRHGITRAKHPAPERLEITEEVNATTNYFAMGEGLRNGAPVRFQASYSLQSGADEIEIGYFDAPAETYVAWGGVALAIGVAGIHPYDDFSADDLRAFGQLTPADEMALFEELFNNRVIGLIQGIMMTNAATLNTMRSFNYALNACAGVENCTIMPDGTGGYTAEID